MRITVRMKYSALSTELIAKASIVGNRTARFPVSTAAIAKKSFAENPAKIGIPTIENEQSVKKIPALRSRIPLPCRFWNSRLSPDTRARRGVVRNNSDFVTAWAII